MCSSLQQFVLMHKACYMSHKALCLLLPGALSLDTKPDTPTLAVAAFWWILIPLMLSLSCLCVSRADQASHLSHPHCPSAIEKSSINQYCCSHLGPAWPRPDTMWSDSMVSLRGILLLKKKKSSTGFRLAQHQKDQMQSAEQKQGFNLFFPPVTLLWCLSENLWTL